MLCHSLTKTTEYKTRLLSDSHPILNTFQPVSGYRSVMNLPSKNCQINPTVTLLKTNGQNTIARNIFLLFIFVFKANAKRKPNTLAN